MQPIGTSSASYSHTHISVFSDGPTNAWWWKQPSSTPPTIRVYDAWDAVEVTRTTKHCGHFRGRWGDRRTGETGSNVRPCESLRCKTCGPKLVTRLLERSHLAFLASERIWYSVAPHTPSVTDRITDRRRAGVRKNFWVSSGGTLKIFSTWHLSGTGEPSASVEFGPWAATTLLANCLALPWVDKISTSAWPEIGPLRHQSTSSDNYKGFGSWNSETWERIMERAICRAEEETHTPCVGDRPPQGMSVDRWFDLIEEEEYRELNRYKSF